MLTTSNFATSYSRHFYHCSFSCAADGSLSDAEVSRTWRAKFYCLWNALKLFSFVYYTYPDVLTRKTCLKSLARDWVEGGADHIFASSMQLTSGNQLQSFPKSEQVAVFRNTFWRAYASVTALIKRKNRPKTFRRVKKGTGIFWKIPGAIYRFNFSHQLSPTEK